MEYVVCESHVTSVQQFNVDLGGPFECNVTQMGVGGGVRFSEKKRYNVQCY